MHFSEFMPISFSRKQIKHENTQSLSFSYLIKMSAGVNTGMQSINTESLFNIRGKIYVCAFRNSGKRVRVLLTQLLLPAFRSQESSHFLPLMLLWVSIPFWNCFQGFGEICCSNWKRNNDIGISYTINKALLTQKPSKPDSFTGTCKICECILIIMFRV